MSQLPAARQPAFPVPLGPEEAVLYRQGLWHEPARESIIRRYWRLFYKYRWIVLAAVGICIAGAMIATMLMQPRYTSTATIQVVRQAPKVIDMNNADETDDTDGGTSMEFYQTQYALLKSRSLSQRVVQDLGLWNQYPYFSGEADLSPDEFEAMPPSQRVELATTMVNNNTMVTPVRGSSIIEVGFEAFNPVLSAEVANSITQNFIQSNLSRRFEAAAYARDFLRKRLQQIRARLEDSERKAVEYAQRQGLIKVRSGTADSANEQSLVANQLTELSTQLTQARAQRAQAEAQYRAGASGNAAAQALANPTINTLHSQRAELLGQLSKLESDFGPEYPPVVALRSQISELDRQTARERARVGSSVSQDLAGRFRQALATERQLQARVDGLKAQLLGEQNRSIQFNILQRDVDTNRALYDALLQRFKEVGVAGGVGTNNVSVVDRALPPDHQSSPNIALNLALGLLLGLVIGGIAALVADQLAESVILPSEFQNQLRVPLLGSTPATGQKPHQKLLPFGGSSAKSDSAVMLVDGHSDLAEAYFSILTAVQFSTANGAPKTMSVTSSQAQEGKSTTALALAKGLASLGKRVLLIDADLRNPTLHRAFAVERGKGFSELLSGQAKLDDVIRGTDAEGLAILTAGKVPPNPAELLAGEGLTRTMKSASERFDHIIFDSPPVLGLADAPLIARAVDGTIFITEAGRTRSSQARHALDRLAAVRANILGAVLTKLDSKNAGYGYGYGYSYKYGGPGTASA